MSKVHDEHKRATMANQTTVPVEMVQDAVKAALEKPRERNCPFYGRHLVRARNPFVLIASSASSSPPTVRATRIT